MNVHQRLALKAILILPLLAWTVIGNPRDTFADLAAAARCRASLSPEAKLIYDNVFPLITSATVIRDVIKSQTRSLVFAGKVERATARASAEEAGECFRQLRQPH